MSGEVNSITALPEVSVPTVEEKPQATENEQDQEIINSIEASLNSTEPIGAVEQFNQNEKSNDNNLLEIINSMEADRKKFIEHVRSKISNQEKDNEKVKEENKRMAKRIVELENCLKQNGTAAASCTKGKQNNKLNETNDILAKAKTLLFEKTKICKQQEQQLNALNNQVAATKEVLDITKDMLNLRNVENLHFQSRLEAMELRLKAERDRQQITDRKVEVSKKMYTDLRSEYDIQSQIFKELRKGYEDKIAFLEKSLEAKNAA